MTCPCTIFKDVFYSMPQSACCSKTLGGRVVSSKHTCLACSCEKLQKAAFHMNRPTGSDPTIPPEPVEATLRNKVKVQHVVWGRPWTFNG